MKNIFLNFFLLTFFQLSYGQSKEIEIVQNNVDGEITISVKNNSKERKEVTVNVTGTGFEKIKTPIIKLVNINETIEFVTLKPSTKKAIKFNLNYTFTSKSDVNETEIISEKHESKSLKLETDLTKGIFVFSKNGCSRCGNVIKYLNENDITFTNLNVTENKEFNVLMWQKLSEIKVTSTITMPVVMINGKLTHSHKDLNLFLKNIKK